MVSYNALKNRPHEYNPPGRTRRIDCGRGTESCRYRGALRGSAPGTGIVHRASSIAGLAHASTCGIATVTDGAEEPTEAPDELPEHGGGGGQVQSEFTRPPPGTARCSPVDRTLRPGRGCRCHMATHEPDGRHESHWRCKHRHSPHKSSDQGASSSTQRGAELATVLPMDAGEATHCPDASQDMTR